MIFIIVGGVVEFDFSRLVKILDELVEEGKVNGEKIIAQIGHVKYEPSNYEWFRFVDGEQFNQFIEEADIIITHGGVGSLLKAMGMGKKVIAFPRLEKYGEHIDNHQTEITKMLATYGYIKCATDKNELLNSLLMIDTFSPKKFHGNNTRMVKTITSFLDGLEFK